MTNSLRLHVFIALISSNAPARLNKSLHLWCTQTTHTAPLLTNCSTYESCYIRDAFRFVRSCCGFADVICLLLYLLTFCKCCFCLHSTVDVIEPKTVHRGIWIWLDQTNKSHVFTSDINWTCTFDAPNIATYLMWRCLRRCWYMNRVCFFSSISSGLSGGTRPNDIW